MNQILPVVGMGATLCFYTDRRAATIIEVSPNGRTVKVQRDNVTRTDGNGMSDAQQYTYAPNTQARVEVFTLRKNGRYVAKGDTMNGLAIAIGTRAEYYDYSF